MGPWRVKFENPDPQGEHESVAAYIARLGYVPWRRLADGRGLLGVAAMCPLCGSSGVVGLVPRAQKGNVHVWQWNGNFDRPTLSPSVHYVDAGLPCGFHCWVRDGQIIDAGTPAH